MAFTASAVTQVYDALSPEDKVKMESMNTFSLVDVVWKLVNKNRAIEEVGGPRRLLGGR